MQHCLSDSSAPRIISKVLGEALTPLQLQSVEIVPYMDTRLIFAGSQALLSQRVETCIASHEPRMVGQQRKVFFVRSR